MSPRDYQLGRRQAAVDSTRRKVVDAARDLLADQAGYPAFTLDAVARRADVARATVYYQFGSKARLLEALYDGLAESDGLEELAAAFVEPDPDEALRMFVACFGRFWSSDRLVLRRIRALGALDPEIGALIGSRDERRRASVRVLVGRLAEGGSGGGVDGEGRGGGGGIGRCVAAVHVLTGFEVFDTLAGVDREPGDVVPEVTDLVFKAVSVFFGLRSRSG
jgi:AcrR family transcriptional regulator